MTAPMTAMGLARDRALARVGALLLVLTVALALVGLERPTTPVACDFAKAILCAEFPTSGSHLSALLESPPNALWQWRLAVWLDMPFLIAYGALLALSVAPLGGRSRVGLATSAVAIAGAALDVVENVGILIATGATPATDGLAAFIGGAAAAKFTLLGVAAAGLAAFAVARRRDRPLLATAASVGGALALGGALTGWFVPRAFEVGALGIAVSCLALWVRALLAMRRGA